MTKVHTWLFVDKISLITKDQTPAVEKATTKYAIFKVKSAKNERIERIEKMIYMWKIERIEKKLMK